MRRGRRTTAARLAGLVAALLATSVAHAQGASDACEARPSSYRFLRYLERYDGVRDPSCPIDLWDSVKYMPFGTASAAFATLGGDLRLQWINARYLSFGNEGGDNHGVALERIHLHTNIRLAPALRFFFELKSDFEQRREPGPLAVDVDRLDIHQAFVDFGTDRSPQLRIGRQELVYGSGRRIFPRNGPNVRGSFDAVRGSVPLADGQVDAFAFRPVGVDPGVFDDQAVNAQSFWGLYATLGGQGRSASGIDAYYIGLRRHGARFSQGAATELRQTLGARLFGKFDGWDFDHELALQWGRFGASSIRAWGASGESGYTWAAVAARPRVSLRMDVASGDHDPAAGDLQTFNSLLPRGGVISDGFTLSPANLTHARGAVNWSLSPSVAAMVALETMWRTSRRDGVYGAGGNLILAPGTSLARHVGDDVDASVAWSIDRHASVLVTFGYFKSGRFIHESGAPRDMSYLTTTLYYRF